MVTVWGGKKAEVQALFPDSTVSHLLSSCWPEQVPHLYGITSGQDGQPSQWQRRVGSWGYNAAGPPH